jgi:hypothetical protein
MIYCLNLMDKYVGDIKFIYLINIIFKGIEMKIIFFLNKIHQSLFAKNNDLKSMDLAIQRVTQKQQIQSHLILFKTDYLE